MLVDDRRRRRLIESRRNQGICEFARSFPRGTDTWILRAVFEEFMIYLSVVGHPISVRRSDYWETDLGMDSEDLDDLVRDAALRAGRSMDTFEDNPLYGRIQTVGDLVEFLNQQPRLVEPSGAANGVPLGLQG